VSNSETTVWTPDKPASAFTEEEVRQAPDFRTLRDVMPEAVKDEKVLELALGAIEARWVTIRDNKRDELVETFVARLRECDPELAKVSRIEISFDEDGISMEFKRERAPRWDAKTYATRIGTYYKEYTSAKHPDSSGEYRLDIVAGRHDDEDVFMRLTEPSGNVLQYPPVDEKNLVGRIEPFVIGTDKDGKEIREDRDADAELVECSSISRLLRDSSHKTTLSVWQYFGLNRETPAT